VLTISSRPVGICIHRRQTHGDVITSDVMIMGKTDHGQLPIYHMLFSHSDLLERVPFEAPCRLPSIWKPNIAFEA